MLLNRKIINLLKFDTGQEQKPPIQKGAGFCMRGYRLTTKPDNFTAGIKNIW